MKISALVLLIFCFCPNSCFAAQIYGTLRDTGRPVGPRVKVEVTCGRSLYPAETDNYGSYKLFANETGRCTLRVHYQNQAPEIAVDSYRDPAHNDFDLIREPNGQYLLRRR